MAIKTIKKYTYEKNRFHTGNAHLYPIGDQL
jgi:hypothetical protein